MRSSPYKLRFRYERGAFREYATFSWPLFVGSTSGVLMWQVPLVIAARTLGAASIGAVTLASQMTQYTRQVDDIVTHALYPAISAVKYRSDLLFESFSKSNRLALLWGFPVGIGAALFAEPAVHFILGPDWMLAVPLVQVLGVSAALDQIGFNWTAFARARGETRVLALAAVAMMVAVLGVGVPLLIEHGLSGLAIGLAAGTVTSLVIRVAYLTKLFPALDMVGHVARAIAPTNPGRRIDPGRAPRHWLRQPVLTRAGSRRADRVRSRGGRADLASRGCAAPGGGGLPQACQRLGSGW